MSYIIEYCKIMKKHLHTICTRALKNYHFSLYTVSATFLSIILTRLSIENWINGFATESFTFYLFEFLHTSLFFLLVFIIFTWLLIAIAKIPFAQSVFILLCGMLFIIFPPIWDWMISLVFFDGEHFMSYYLFDSIPGLAQRFVTFFGDSPRNGITYGTRMMIACAIFALTSITWLKTKSILRTVTIACTAYAIFFLLSAFPSLITMFFTSNHIATTQLDVTRFIASPTKILGNQIISPISSVNIKMSFVYVLSTCITILLILYKTHKKQLHHLIANVRPVQTLYHIGLLIIGMGLAIIFNHAIILPSFFTALALTTLCIAIIIAWYATVVFNDIVDQDIDTISNPHRPLIQKIISVQSYRNIGILFIALSIILTAMVNAHSALLIIAYHALSYLYNAPPFRLKRFPLIATFLAALASFFIVAIGFITITPEHSLTGFPPYIAILLIVAYTISLPIKDLKDIAGDKKNHIYTIPVLCGEKTGRLIISTGIFTSFVLSIFTLNNFSLFFPAILAGSLCFWIVTGQKKGRFLFSPHMTIRSVFSIVCIYSIILMLTLLP